MYKVLIADDDQFVLDGLRHIVNWKDLDFEIVATTLDGKTALEYIKQHKIDVLITDIKMPGMTGIELIQWIRNHQLDIKCIVLSGHDDYHYMQQAIRLNIENYLLKSINESELQETLQNIAEKLRLDNRKMPIEQNNILYENILLRWLNGRIRERELKERAYLLDMPLDASSFCAAILRLDSALSNLDITEDSWIKINKQIHLFLTSRPIQAMFLRTYENDFIFLFSHKKDLINIKTVYEVLIKMAESISSLFGYHCFFTIGKPVTSYQKVHHSYHQALTSLGYSLLLDWPNGICYSSEDLATSKQNILPTTEQENFRKLLLCSSDDLLPFLQTIYSHTYNIKFYTPHYLKNTTLRLANIVLETSEYFNLSSETLFFDLSFLEEQVYSLKRRQAHYSWICTIVNKFRLSQSNTVFTVSPVIQRVLNYIHDHYTENISLKYLAQHFNINPAYLGRIFKEELNKSFSVYLNYLRIAHAKELLQNSDKNINEIGKLVGYPNPNHFVETFKKHVGCLPGDYKKR